MFSILFNLFVTKSLGEVSAMQIVFVLKTVVKVFWNVVKFQEIEWKIEMQCFE